MKDKNNEEILKKENNFKNNLDNKAKNQKIQKNNDSYNNVSKKSNITNQSKNIKNILFNQIPTSASNQVITEEISSELNRIFSKIMNNSNEEEKENFIQINPKVTKVTLTKFYPKSRNFNKLELAKNFINSVRNSRNNINKIKMMEQDKKRDPFSNRLNYSLKTKNEENNPNQKKENIEFNEIKKMYTNVIKINSDKSLENYNNNLINLIKQNKYHNKNKEQIKLNYDNYFKNNLVKSKSKPNISHLNLNENKSGNYTTINNQIEQLVEENNIIKQENEFLNKEIKRLNEYIRKQNIKIQNYKNNKKINEEQIKYLLTLKDSNIISHKEKDSLIEEMKTNILLLQKEINDKKEEINSLYKLLDSNNKENNFENKKIFEDLKLTLASNDNEKNENEKIKNLNIKLQIKINELNEKLKLKEEEINKVKNEFENTFSNLDEMKKDYENLFKKYNEQNNSIEQIIKNKNSNKNLIKNTSFINYNNNNKIHKNPEQNIFKNAMNNFNKNKINKSCSNIRFSNNNINTFYKYRHETPIFLKRINSLINIKGNDEDLNFINNDENTTLKENRLNNKNKMKNYSFESKNNYNNLTNDFYNNKTNNLFCVEKYYNTMDNTNQFIKNNITNINPAEVNFTKNAIEHFPVIYTLVGSNIIGFNLLKKTFMIIKPIDKTENIFYKNIKILREDNILPTTINNSLGFFMLINDLLFFYSQTNNTLSILEKLNTNHCNGGFISVDNELYIISGMDTTFCEFYSPDSKQLYNLPSVNFKRINSGICNINNEYIYSIFGRNSENTIERLNIGKDWKGKKKWELLRVNIELTKNPKLYNLQQFLSFYNNDNDIIIIGGYNYIKNINNEILKYSISDNSIQSIGILNLHSFYINQISFIDNDLFAIYDANNGLHFFNNDLENHLVFNFHI